MLCLCQKRKVDQEIVNVDEQPTNLRLRCNAVMSIWNKMFVEWFQHLVASVLPRVGGLFWRQKEVPCGTSRVYPIKWPVIHTCDSHSGFVLYFFQPVIHTPMISMIVLLPSLNISSTANNNYNNKTVLRLCLCRAVRGAVGDGNAHSPEVAGLRGSCDTLCHFRLLCGVDCFHPSHHGGTLSFSARASFTLVRLTSALNWQ